MLIRETPKNLSQYLAVTNEESNKLHKAGYKPMYMDDKAIYYKWTEGLRNNYTRILGGEKVG